MMLTVDDVHSYYAMSHVLRGVNLEVGRGEVVGLLGRNGMGKTTLVRTVAGLTPPVLRGGTVALNGEVVSGLPSHVIARRGVGLVPQGRGIFASLSTEENLTVTARRGPGGDTWDLAAAYELFPRLAERRRNLGCNLSGGEQQMLAIARALLTNPLLLVMDEPSEGLAPAVIDHLGERISALSQTGLSILLVEQNIHLALTTSDRLYVLGEGGAVAWTGRPAELDNSTELKEYLLGVSTRELKP